MNTRHPIKRPRWGAITALFAFGGLACAAPLSGQAKASDSTQTTRRWQYKVVREWKWPHEGKTVNLDQVCDSLGALGWELVTVLQPATGQMAWQTLYFKRPLP